MIGCKPKEHGSRQPAYGRFDDIRKGDKVVYYATGDKIIVGIFDIISDMERLESDPEWGEQLVYRIKADLMPPRGKYLDFKALIKDPSVKFDLFPDKKRWPYQIWQHTCRPLTKNDFDLIYQQIQRLRIEPEQAVSVTPREKIGAPEAGPPADIDVITKQLRDREAEIDRLKTLVQEREEQLRRLQAQLAPSLLDTIIEKLGKAPQVRFEEFEFLLAQAFSQIGFEAKWNGEMKGDEPLHVAPQGKADVEVLAPLAGDPYYIVVEGTKNEDEKYQVTEVHGAVDHSKGFPIPPYRSCYRLVIAPHFKKGAIEACDRMDPRYPVMLLTSDNLIEVLRFHKEVGGVTQEEVKKLFDQASGKGEVRRDQIEIWENTVREQRKKLSLSLDIYDILYREKDFMWPRDIWRELREMRNQQGLPVEPEDRVRDILKILDTIGALVVKPSPDKDPEKDEYKAGLTPEGFRLRIRKLEETIRLHETGNLQRPDKIVSYVG